MTRKIYRTAQGKQVDLGALQLQNETVRAVGNMGVNARGDLIDGENRAIQSKNSSVRKSYDRQISNVHNQPVTKQPQPDARPQKQRKSEKVQMPQDQPLAPEQNETQAPETPTTGGLAEAIAKARVLREQPLTSHQDLVKTRPGLAKI